ncbi:MAG TPA: elongation factor P maturation arginine rhamnosyltransferase EarP [bacterium]|nr:elongation factor P maturation arginine rhamnosyltransferase EarP [bacterium]
MTIDLLCKVVDNFGDIGVAYRLARALSELDDPPTLRIIVDNLEAFNALCPEVDPRQNVQLVRGWTVLSWHADALMSYRSCYERDPARVVLEAFACGRPEWLETMLFDPADLATKTIINIEYLTAEPYADEFHLMPSLTRSPLVRKYMFMPGFTANTGGLILDGHFLDSIGHGIDSRGRQAMRVELARRLGIAAELASEQHTWIVVFGYERDYSRIVADIAEFGRQRPVVVFAANGKSQPCLEAAWQNAGRPFALERLPFLEQLVWDALLVATDFSIVRGEDSLSRAALSGRPFLWHAYPQDDAYQLVKVRALLERMAPYFAPDLFAPLRETFIAFNDRTTDGPHVIGTESILPVLQAASSLQTGFAGWSAVLASNGNMAAHLMTCIHKIV